jgi:hypothetical protein
LEPAPALRGLGDLPQRDGARVAVERPEERGDRVREVAPGQVVEGVRVAPRELDHLRAAVRQVGRRQLARGFAVADRGRLAVAVSIAAAVLAAVRGRRRVRRQPALRGRRGLHRGASAAAAAAATAAVREVPGGAWRGAIVGAAEDRLIVVVLLVEHLGRAGGGLGAHDVVGAGGPHDDLLLLVLVHDRAGRARRGDHGGGRLPDHGRGGGFLVGLRGLVGLCGLVFLVGAGGPRRRGGLLRRRGGLGGVCVDRDGLLVLHLFLARRVIDLAALLLPFEARLDRLLVPLAEGEDARLHADERQLRGVLLQHRREARAHRHLGALAHVRQEVLLDRDVRDLFVVKRPAHEAQHLGRSVRKRHDVRLFPSRADGRGTRPSRVHLSRKRERGPGHFLTPPRPGSAHRSHSAAGAVA